jgi:hypothetical protein
LVITFSAHAQEVARANPNVVTKNYYTLTGDIRRGFLLSPEDSNGETENFEYCDGERTLVDLSDLVPIEEVCDDPTGPLNVGSLSDWIGAPVYNEKFMQIGSVNSVFVEDGNPMVSVVKASDPATLVVTPVSPEYADFLKSFDGAPSVVVRDGAGAAS